jgi:hypothetical protein
MAECVRPANGLSEVFLDRGFESHPSAIRIRGTKRISLLAENSMPRLHIWTHGLPMNVADSLKWPQARTVGGASPDDTTT